MTNLIRASRLALAVATFSIVASVGQAHNDGTLSWVHDPATADGPVWFEVEVDGVGIVPHVVLVERPYGGVMQYRVRIDGPLPPIYRIRVFALTATQRSEPDPWSEPMGDVPRIDFNGNGYGDLNDLGRVIRVMYVQ